jgi:hypothetical protein
MRFRQIQNILNSFLLLATPLCLFMLGSCGDGNRSPEDSVSGAGALSFSIVYHDGTDGDFRLEAARIDCADQGIVTIEARVYSPDYQTPVVGGPWDCEDGEGTISSVPAGKSQTIVVLGKDAEETVIFRGQKSDINVIANMVNHLGAVECHDFVPNLLSPIDGAVVVQGVATLKWEEVAGATDYRVKVSQSSDMEHPLIDEFTSMVDYTATGLAYETTYYWQVVASDAGENTGRGSQIRAIEITQSAGRLPDTGQEQIDGYTPVPGEDMTYAINPPSYTKLDSSGNELDAGAAQWAMVRDNVTGLIWEVKTDDDTVHDKDNQYNRTNARKQFIAELNETKFGGYNDWRLPTVKELAGIAHKSRGNPAINPDFFPHTVSSIGYCSDTTLSVKIGFTTIGYVWSVAYNYGGVVRHSINTDDTLHVRAVRGGQLTGNLVDNGDGTVTDTATGLMWQQAEAGTMAWSEALDYCETLSLAGYSDWRLPNINELFSIVHYENKMTYDTNYIPTDEEIIYIDTTIFPKAAANYYWSSTTLATSTDMAWKVSFSKGQTGTHQKPTGYHVRAVRHADLVLDD